MNDNRKKIVEEIFNKLDINHSNAIEKEELKSKFNAKNHPDVLNIKNIFLVLKKTILMN